MTTPNLRPNQKNKYRAAWEFAHGSALVDSIPCQFQIALSNTCNFKCVYCPDHRAGNTYARNKLDGKTYGDLLTLIPRAEWLAFHGISEFMMDPKFFDMVERSANAGATLFVNTNGSVCTPKYLNALAAYPGQLQMNFSLDAATPKTFMRMRGWNFRRVVRNIKAYVDRFEERRNRTWLTLSFVITKGNVGEMVPFLFIAKALKVDQVRYFRLYEGPHHDWRIEAKAGGIFDYHEESTSAFVSDYNRELENTRQVAEMLGLCIDLPAPVPTQQPIEITEAPEERYPEVALAPAQQPIEIMEASEERFPEVALVPNSKTD